MKTDEKKEKRLRIVSKMIQDNYPGSKKRVKQIKKSVYNKLIKHLLEENEFQRKLIKALRATVDELNERIETM